MLGLSVRLAIWLSVRLSVRRRRGVSIGRAIPRLRTIRRAVILLIICLRRRRRHKFPINLDKNRGDGIPTEYKRDGNYGPDPDEFVDKVFLLNFELGTFLLSHFLRPSEVAEALKSLKALVALLLGRVVRPSSSRILTIEIERSKVPEGIIFRSSFLIGKDLVGLCDELEFLLVSLVAIWMVLFRQFVVALFYLLLGRFRLSSQDFVVILASVKLGLEEASLNSERASEHSPQIYHSIKFNFNS